MENIINHCTKCNYQTSKRTCEICGTEMINSTIDYINAQVATNLKVISIGYRCSIAAILNEMKLKTESYPFDWIVSNLDVATDCITSEFSHFLNKDNYALGQNNHVLPITSPHSCLNLTIAHSYVNTHYESDLTKCVFESNLSFPHKNIIDDFDYYIRCINRFTQTLSNPTEKKALVYIHPIMSFSDWICIHKSTLARFRQFTRFMLTKSNNLKKVIYFVLVYNKAPDEDDSVKCHLILEKPKYVVWLIYCDNPFIDIGILHFAGCDPVKCQIKAAINSSINTL